VHRLDSTASLERSAAAVDALLARIAALRVP
jgi:hypothetical protein